MTPRFDFDAFALYLLGALEADEARAIEEALAAGDPETVAGVADARRLVGALGLAATSAEPPAGARERLLARVRRESSDAAPYSSRAVPPDRIPARLPRRALLAPAVIAAVFVLVGLASLWNSFASRGADDDVRRLARAAAGPRTVTIDLRSTASKSVEGRVLYDPDQRALFVSGKGLLPAGDGRRYVLWVLPKGGLAPRSLGAFAIQADDRPDAVRLGVPPPGDVAGYAVSSERDPDVTAPTDVRSVALSGG